MSRLRRLLAWLFGMDEAPGEYDEFEDLDGPDGPHGRPTV